MHHAYTLLVMASIVASAPTYATGSCLSYGHSCWGAHGKRSGDETRWFVSKLAPLPLNNHARFAHLIFNQQSRTESEEDGDGNSRRLAGVNDDDSQRQQASRIGGHSKVKRLVLVRPPVRPSSSDAVVGGDVAEDSGGFNQRAFSMAGDRPAPVVDSGDFILTGRPARLIRLVNQIPKDLEEKIEE